jgi:hypothetical protein
MEISPQFKKGRTGEDRKRLRPINANAAHVPDVP